LADSTAFPFSISTLTGIPSKYSSAILENAHYLEFDDAFSSLMASRQPSIFLNEKDSSFKLGRRLLQHHYHGPVTAQYISFYPLLTTAEADYF
jgi:hypothetical protein